jgi:DNA-binding NtrC family response regulator
LRERKEDIPELFAFLVSAALPEGCAGALAPSPRLMDALMCYSWPGNLRELQNLARSYRLAPDPEQMIAELERRAEALRSVHPGNGRLSLKEQVQRVSRQFESEIILKALERHRWNRRRAAETLQISYRSLLYKMKSCDLRLESTGRSNGKE